MDKTVNIDKRIENRENLMMKKILIFILSLSLINCSHKKINHEDIIDEFITIVSVNPRYPELAKKERIEGEVTVEFIINIKGSVVQPKIISSKPQGVFDEASINAILKYKFKPRFVNSIAVEAKAVQTFLFKLNQH